MESITEQYTLTLTKDDLLQIVKYYVEHRLNGRVVMVQKLFDTQAVSYSHLDSTLVAVSVKGSDEVVRNIDGPSNEAK